MKPFFKHIILLSALSFVFFGYASAQAPSQPPYYGPLDNTVYIPVTHNGFNWYLTGQTLQDSLSFQIDNKNNDRLFKLLSQILISDSAISCDSIMDIGFHTVHAMSQARADSLHYPSIKGGILMCYFHTNKFQGSQIFIENRTGKMFTRYYYQTANPSYSPWVVQINTGDVVQDLTTPDSLKVPSAVAVANALEGAKNIGNSDLEIPTNTIRTLTGASGSSFFSSTLKVGDIDTSSFKGNDYFNYMGIGPQANPYGGSGSGGLYLHGNDGYIDMTDNFTKMYNYEGFIYSDGNYDTFKINNGFYYKNGGYGGFFSMTDNGQLYLSGSSDTMGLTNSGIFTVGLKQDYGYRLSYNGSSGQLYLSANNGDDSTKPYYYFGYGVDMRTNSGAINLDGNGGVNVTSNADINLTTSSAPIQLTSGSTIDLKTQSSPISLTSVDAPIILEDSNNVIQLNAFNNLIQLNAGYSQVNILPSGTFDFKNDSTGLHIQFDSSGSRFNTSVIGLPAIKDSEYVTLGQVKEMVSDTRTYSYLDYDLTDTADNVQHLSFEIDSTGGDYNYTVFLTAKSAPAAQNGVVYIDSVTHSGGTIEFDVVNADGDNIRYGSRYDILIVGIKKESD